MKEKKTVFDIEADMALSRLEAQLRQFEAQSKRADRWAIIIFALMLLYIAALCAAPYFEDDDQTDRIEEKP